MRRMIFALLFISQIAWADDIAEVLSDLKSKTSGSYARAEKLYQTSKVAADSARIATVLAFAPTKQTKTPYYVYAYFAFKQDHTLPIELRLKMAKLAGEGFFENAQFQKALTVFGEAAALPGIDQSTHEYLEYQMAWCDVNMKRPSAAIKRLQAWLKSCPKCSLRQEMAGDIGKIWTETSDPLPEISATEQKSYIEGIAHGLERKAHFNLAETSAQLRGRPEFDVWLETVFSDAQFKSLTPCQRLTGTSVEDAKSWAKTGMERVLRTCTQNLIAGKNEGVPAKFVMSLFNAQPPTQGQDLMWWGQLAEKSHLPEDACQVRLKAANLPAVVAADVYLASVDSVCGPDKGVEIAKLFTTPEFLKSLKALPPQAFERTMSAHLHAIATHSTWAKDFASIPPTTWIQSTAATPTVLKNVILDAKWALPYRLSIWRLTPVEIALDSNVVSELAHTASTELSHEDYLQFMNEAQKRAGHPDSYLALLTLRASPAQADLYSQFRGEEQWNRLTPDEQVEAMRGLLKQNQSRAFLADWDLWTPRMEKKPELFRLYVSAFTEAEMPASVPHPNKNNFSTILRSIFDWRANAAEPTPVATQIKDEPLARDLVFVEENVKASKALNQIKITETTPEAIEKQIDLGMAIGSGRIRELKKHKWSMQPLAKLNREILKRGLVSFREEILRFSASDVKFADYAQVAKLVKRWEAKL